MPSPTYTPASPKSQRTAFSVATPPRQSGNSSPSLAWAPPVSWIIPPGIKYRKSTWAFPGSRSSIRKCELTAKSRSPVYLVCGRSALFVITVYGFRSAFISGGSVFFLLPYRVAPVTPKPEANSRREPKQHLIAVACLGRTGRTGSRPNSIVGIVGVVGVAAAVTSSGDCFCLLVLANFTNMLFFTILARRRFLDDCPIAEGMR